ncbi:MAG: hypothetical protein K8T90_21565 [Planctomycetes bacterium]|nr:hypothetical protein [Planctomycetota bacterium]
MRIRTALVASILLAAALVAGSAAESRVCLAGDSPESCVPDPREAAAKLEEEINGLFAEKKYAEAAEKCRAEIALVPTAASAHYNLACALARLGKTDDALAALKKSAELGFDDAAHAKEDADLASIRDAKGFAAILEICTANEAKAAVGTYDPGFDMPGLKSVEGTPEGGLRWRMYLSKTADAEHPQRLIVWLHPSGGSMNGTVAQLAAKWSEDGFAVLLPTQKRWSGWSEGDVRKLLETTIPDAAKTPGVDAKRPVLAGFSAGGQVALSLWREDASRFGGLLVDAAYPIDMEKYAQGTSTAFALPKGEAVKSVPIYVLVGDKDGGTRLWTQVEADWIAAGVPLHVRTIADGRHEWLLRADEEPAVRAWLRDVAAGKTPGAATSPTAPAAPSPAAPTAPTAPSAPPK